MKISAFKKAQTGKIQYLGEVLNFTYKPLAVTRNSMRAAMEKAAEAEKAKDQSLAAVYEKSIAYVDYLIDIILVSLISWDLEGDEGPLPLTRETFADLPQDFITAIQQVVMGTADPEKKATSPSDTESGSSTVESAA